VFYNHSVETVRKSSRLSEIKQFFPQVFIVYIKLSMMIQPLR